MRWLINENYVPSLFGDFRGFVLFLFSGFSAILCGLQDPSSGPQQWKHRVPNTRSARQFLSP